MARAIFPIFTHSHGLRCQRSVALIFAVAAAITSDLLLPRLARCDDPADQSPRKIVQKTSDGVDMAIWYYPSPAEQAEGTVLIVHEIGGSHTSIESLALGLQAANYSVVIPDLRGHGESTSRTIAGRSETLNGSRLRKADLESIAISAAGGAGPVRSDSRSKGDVETTYAWIKAQSSSDKRLAHERLCVVGCGLGGTLATMWTDADASWPHLDSGPQGGNVRALALVSPLFSSKGVSLASAMKKPAVGQHVPIVIISGTADRDADRVFDQLKRFRPEEWYSRRPDGEKFAKDRRDASLFLFQFDTEETADQLAQAGSEVIAPLLAQFFQEQLSR